MVVKRVTLWLINILFPPLAVFLLCGAGPDLFVNSLLFLCAVLPAHLHASYILHTYFHRRKKVRKHRYPGKQPRFVYSEEVARGGADAREVRRLARLERTGEKGGRASGKKGRVRSVVGRLLHPCRGRESEYEAVIGTEERRPGLTRHASAPPGTIHFQQQQRSSRPASIREAAVAALVGADGADGAGGGGGDFQLGRMATTPTSLSRTQSRALRQPHYQPQHQQHPSPEQQQLLPQRRPSRRRTHSADPVPRRRSTRDRPRPDSATLGQQQPSAGPPAAGRESAVAVERWMQGWHGDDGDVWGAEPPPLLPPRRDDEQALATGASDERGGATPTRRRTLHRVGARQSLT